MTALSPRSFRRRVAVLCMLALAAPIGAFASGGQASLRARSNRARQSSTETARRPAAPEGTQPAIGLQVDDGSYEITIGIVDDAQTYGNQAVFLTRFTPSPQDLPLTIDTVSILFPVSDENGSTGLEAGMNFDVLVYTDSQGTGLPANATLVRRQGIHLAPSNTAFQDVLLDSPVSVASGDVWIGFTNTVTRTAEAPIFPGAIDLGESQSRSWIFFNPAQHRHFDGSVLASAEAALNLDETSYAGNWMIRASGQSGATVELNWEDPDPAEGTSGAPQFLTATPVTGKVATAGTPDAAAEPSSGPPAPLARTAPAADAATAPGATVIAFKIYRSATSPVTTDPANIFATVPPDQHSARSSTSSRGSFFVATACFADGSESPPSNEASGGIPAATLLSLKVTATKIAAGGSGFTSSVEVFLDNIGFVTPAKVKKSNRKVVQKGALENGQTIAQYLTHGREVLISFRNSDGGIASAKFTVP